jgi:hypothetical protein
VSPGASFPVEVTVKNISLHTWPDRESADPRSSGAGAVRLGGRWWKGGKKKEPLEYLPVRGELSAPVAAGESALLTLPVTAPSEAGEYQLQLDLVQELVTWFETKGAATLIVPVRVR